MEQILTKDEAINLYKDTKNKTPFATPMRTIGTNKISELYNTCMNEPTFQYTRYSSSNNECNGNHDCGSGSGGSSGSSSSGNNSNSKKYWISNPLYESDITQETTNLKNNYIDKIQNNRDNIYKSVFEDMNILCYDPSNTDKMQKNIDYKGISYTRGK